LKIRDDVCKIDDPAGSRRFKFACLDGGHFESRRDSRWSRRGGLNPDRRRIGDANDDRSHNGRCSGNRQDRLLCVIQSVFRAIAYNRFDSSLQITARHPRYASERRSQPHSQIFPDVAELVRHGERRAQSGAPRPSRIHCSAPREPHYRHIRKQHSFYSASADSPVPAKGLPATLSSSAGASALLQRTLPRGGAEVVALEGAATISGGGGQAETQRQSRRYRERLRSRKVQSQKHLTRLRG